jgi:hypothetical protein
LPALFGDKHRHLMVLEIKTDSQKEMTSSSEALEFRASPWGISHRSPPGSV